MFPNLRSTPKPKIREQSEVSPKLILKKTPASCTELDIDDGYPMLPAVDDILDDVFESSPTPRSSRLNSDQRSFGSGPSSPPLGMAQLQGKPYDEPPSPYNSLTHREVGTEGKRPNISDFTSRIGTVAFAEPVRIPKISEDALQQPLDKSREILLDPKIYSLPANMMDQEMTDINPLSELEVFVDAPSDPLQTTETDIQAQCVEVSTNSPQSQDTSKPSDDRISCEIIQEPSTLYAPSNTIEGDKSNRITSNEEQVSSIVDSFQGSEKSYFPSEDEQIAAQLVSDLERAWSQAESEMKGDGSTTRQSGKACRKRKVSTGRPGPTKKVKANPDIQVVVEPRKPEDADEDYIVVEEDEHSCLSDENLEEGHSPTPPRVTRASARKSKNGRKRTGRARSSSASDCSNPNSRASSEESHLLPIKMNSQLESSSEVPASVDLSSQQRSALFHQSSIESWHAQNSPSSTHQEVDEAPHLAEISRRFESGGETRRLSLGTGEVARDLAIDRPLELYASCGEIARDTATAGSQGSTSPCPLVENRNPATHTCEAQTEMELKTSPSSMIGVSSGQERRLSTSQGLNTAGAVRQDLLDATQQAHRARGILAEFKRLQGEIRHAQLNAEEEREMIGALFECVREVHEAGRRGMAG